MGGRKLQRAPPPYGQIHKAIEKRDCKAAYEWIRKTVDRAPKDLKEEIGKNFLAHISTRREDKLIIKSVV